MAGGGSGEVAFQRRGFSNVQGGGTDWHPADGERLTKDELAVLLERAAECDKRSTNTSFQRVRRTIRTTELNDLLEFVDADFQERVFAGARRWPITRRLQAMRDAIDTYPTVGGENNEGKEDGGVDELLLIKASAVFQLGTADMAARAARLKDERGAAKDLDEAALRVLLGHAGSSTDGDKAALLARWVGVIDKALRPAAVARPGYTPRRDATGDAAAGRQVPRA